MKNLSVFLLCTFSALAAESSEFIYEAAYGVGVADYREKGNIRPIESEWSSVVRDLFLQVQGRLGKSWPYLSVRMSSSETETESWREGGALVQENDLEMAGIDFNLGVKFPIEKSWGELTPFMGILAGFRSYNRDKFRIFNTESTDSGPGVEVVEDVEAYGAGGGIAMVFSVGEHWLWGAETSAHWLLYTYADNDGFNSGIEGQGGLFWKSSLWFAKKLKKTGQIMGLKFTADVQNISGESNRIDGTDETIEWPDNEWESYSVALFWEGRF